MLIFIGSGGASSGSGSGSGVDLVLRRFRILKIPRSVFFLSSILSMGVLS